MMSCNPSNSHANSQIIGQCWPKTGLLHNNLNLSLPDLQSRLRKIPTDNPPDVYSYVIDTIKKNSDGSFVQTGCGPNFEGDVITLCTCKHRMRTYLNIDFWKNKNKWIAGFSSLKAGDNKNVLIYLMSVGQAFESHYELWHSGALSTRAKTKKNSRVNKRGDLYEPKRSPLSESQQFESRNYQDSHHEHSHIKQEKRNKDIAYIGCSRRRPALLVGDRKSSFLWSKPTILRNGKMTQGANKKNISEFLDALERV